MLFRTVVLLTFSVNLLIKGVAPAVRLVILIVVSSACVAPARWVKTVRMEALMISEHAFITFLEVFP
jgi:hypothetical protein